MARTKYIFISGGVMSSVGKGITAASIAKLLQSKGYRVCPIKCESYLNIDSGTIRPTEHGEVFVCDDGIETDQDIGTYERFLDQPLSRDNFVTMGQIYQAIIERERSFGYEGEDVEAVHLCDEIIGRFKTAARKSRADVVVVELGGTVGEYWNIFYYEAYRIMKLRNKDSVFHIHVGYLPTPPTVGEMKSKPTQLSVRLLNSLGIQPDFLVARAERPLDRKRKERLALFCNMDGDDIISNPDLDSVYDVAIKFDEQEFGERILKKLHLKPKSKDLNDWRKLAETVKTVVNEVPIAVVGKYFATGDYVLSDVYVSVIESLKHAGWHYGVKPKLVWVDSEKIEADGAAKYLEGMAGVVVPGGFGGRGIEGIIQAITFAGEHKIPYFGLCYGMQLATIEIARNLADLKGANSTEIDAKTKHPVIHIMPDQEKKLLSRDYGATMRLGAWDCHVTKGTKAHEAYGKTDISERHRHRYEFNNAYRARLEKVGLTISGASPDGKLVEIVELKDHPWFVGVQFHPEFQSRPLRPHPLFREFIGAC
ncbi:MAG: CTP synthase, partial [Candidatus Veblenbacteria bacterium]|nr:CTP synthase [Candidatus Veblenbacteria bacterium]